MIQNTKHILRTTLLLTTSVVVLVATSCTSKTEKTYTANAIEKLYGELASMFESESKDSLAIAKQTVNELLASNSDAATSLGYTFFSGFMGDSLQSEKVLADIVAKFPKGIAARDAALWKIYGLEEPSEQESFYKDWAAKFPPEDFGFHDRYVYPSILGDIINTYIDEENFDKAEVLLDEMVESPATSNSYYYIILSLLDNNKPKLAEKAAKKMLTSVKKWQGNPELTNDEAEVIKENFPVAISYLAQAKSAQGHYEEAAAYFKEYETVRNTEYAYVDTHALAYAETLGKTNEVGKAFEVMQDFIANDMADDAHFELLKSLYVQKNGSEKGYAALETGIEENLRKNMREEIKETIINEPFPDFELKDFDGNTYTKEQLKGKIVVLDFWATWCGACIVSFPAMHGAQQHYKNDPNVKFLFVDTMEGYAGEPLKEAINGVLKRKKVEDFTVVLDTQSKEDPDAYELAGTLGIQGIPQKYYLDGNGTIRYQSAGSSGITRYEKEHVIQIIETIKNLN